MREDIKKIINGEEKQILIRTTNFRKPYIILSGSFNPFHIGHNNLLTAAEKLSGRNGILELSIYNVDKLKINDEKIMNRISKMPKDYSILLSRNATFIEKAESNPEAWFVVGFDTALRLFDKKYHTNIDKIFEKYVDLDVKFLVGGRKKGDSFLTLNDLNIPKELQHIFIDLPEKLFREDISSTDISNNLS